MKKLLILLTTVLSLSILTGCGKTIDLEKYVSINVEGFDGYATAKVEVDELGLAAEVAEAQGKDVNFDSLDGLFSSISIYKVVDDIMNNSTLILSNDEYISNGDLLYVDFKYDNKALKADKIKLTGSKVEKTVSGLMPIQELNPYDFMTVSFEGYDGIGKAKVSYNGPHTYEFNYEVSKRDQLSNGDVIGIEIVRTKETEAYGFTIIKDYEEYTVSGLGNVEDYNPLQYVTVEFSGNNGEGKAKIKYSGEHSEDFQFAIDKKDNLSIGDVVTVSLKNVQKSTYKGYNIVGTEKTFTVDGLKEAFALSTIAEDDYSDLYNAAKSICDEALVKKYNGSNSGLVFQDPESLGYYYTGGIDNYCYYVFKTYLDYKTSNFGKSGTYYYVVGLKNVTYDNDGNFTYKVLEEKWCESMDQVEETLMRYTENKTDAETFEKTIKLPSDYRLATTKEDFDRCSEVLNESLSLTQKYGEYLTLNNQKYAVTTANARIADCMYFSNNVENAIVVIGALDVYYEGRTSGSFTIYMPFEYSNVRVSDSDVMISARPFFANGSGTHKGAITHTGLEDIEKLYQNIAKSYAAFEKVQ